MQKGSILELVEALYPYQYQVNGPGNDAALPVFLKELDFDVHEFPEGAELNGWTIPHSEAVDVATIHKDGELVYDGLASPLGLILLCAPFKGRVSLEQLQQHLFYHTGDPDAIPFHCTQQYRPGKRDWGFCVPKTLFDALTDGKYDVEISVRPAPTTMKVLDFVLPGKTPETVLVQAHNCHPYQANDDISGCAVGIRLFQELLLKKDRHFTYRLLICPELTGSIFWLDKFKKQSNKFIGAIILPAVGNNAEIRLQKSFFGNSQIDRAAIRVLARSDKEIDIGNFREVYGNDETVFDSAGFEIPTISLTRYPFKRYHSNLDTPDTLSEGSLQDTLSLLLEIFDELSNCKSESESEVGEANINIQSGVHRHPVFVGRGLYCLSHPNYGLYKKVWDPSVRTGPTNREEGRSWNLLMTNLPRLLDGHNSIKKISADFNLPENEVQGYVKKWIEAGLVKEPVNEY